MMTVKDDGKDYGLLHCGEFRLYEVLQRRSVFA